MSEENPSSDNQLERSLGPLMIWGLGVGYVISGEYFGWNLGLEHGGPFGMLVATALVTVMYVTFVVSYAEVACVIPRAGGVFVMRPPPLRLRLVRIFKTTCRMCRGYHYPLRPRRLDALYFIDVEPLQIAAVLPRSRKT